MTYSSALLRLRRRPAIGLRGQNYWYAIHGTKRALDLPYRKIAEWWEVWKKSYTDLFLVLFNGLQNGEIL